MSMRTKTTCLSAAIVLAVTMTPRALIAQAGPPLLTDDPETPGNNKWEINIAAIILQRRTERLWSIPLLDINYGLGERIQLKAEIPWMVLQSRSGGRNQTGPGSANVGVKWRFLDRKRHGFAMSTYPQLEFRTSAAAVRKGLSETGAELRLPVELSREFGPVTIIGEVGYQIVQRQKDEWIYGGEPANLFDTIVKGRPNGMPAWAGRIPEYQIWQIIAYLRTLQQPVMAPAGDARRGETLFFGATRCSSCHIVNGRGGRVGPELSTVGSGRSRAYIIESIREPGRRLSENRAFGGDATLKYDTVTLVTADGSTVVGVPLNEDTFTVQVMDLNERVHSLEKKSLKSFRHENRSLMPAYDLNRLSDADLADVVAFLQTLRAGSSAKKGGSHEDR